MSGVDEIAAYEPWRLGQGQPKNALDPTWPGYNPDYCNGEVEWEGVTKWWWCTKCGYCGWFSRTEHFPVETPLSYLVHSVVFFFRKRQEQGMPALPAAGQALFTAGMALRYAATMPPQELGAYATNLIPR